MADSFCNVAWFFRIQSSGLPFADRAESTMTRADIASKHEGRGPIGPAFKNIRTARFLTDSVQVESFDQLQHLVLICGVAQPDAQPFGLWLTDFLIVADYTEFAGQLFTSGGILRCLARRVKRALRNVL
jgi:hypothetical protein